jgi:hypothetical protein
MTQDEAIDVIKMLLRAESEKELQALIGRYLPQMDNTFFAVLTEAAQAESVRNPVVAARLESLAQTLLPLRTLI